MTTPGGDSIPLLVRSNTSKKAEERGDADRGDVDEEMAARVRRKQELLRERQLGLIKGTDLPPDYNPEAGTNLRAKSIGQNLKESLEKQKELKQRKTSLKRDDLCERLGRGC